jgi:predicted RNA-binding Zn-ribbon protein involved in translation (DUF1610 family)
MYRVSLTMPVEVPSFAPELLFPICLCSISPLLVVAYHNYRFPKSNSLLTTGKKIQETRLKNEEAACSGRGMFFFIAGIQPKTVELAASSRMCPNCGLYQAQLKRVDHYLSIFFIPLFPVKKGSPFLECRNCAGVFTETGQPCSEMSNNAPRICSSCGRAMDASFRYCPSCGRPVA